MLNFLNLKKVKVSKSKAMSVQSIIIGSVIRGVIASRGLAMLWPRVDSANVTAEKSTISEINNSIGATMSNKNIGKVIDLDSITKGKEGVLSLINQLPKDFKYYLLQSKDTSGGATDGQIIGGLVRVPNSEERKTKLNIIVKPIEKSFDGVQSSVSDFSKKINGVFNFEEDCNRMNRGCFYTYELKQFEFQSTNQMLWAVVANMANVRGTEYINETVLNMNRGDSLNYTHGGYDRKVFILN